MCKNTTIEKEFGIKKLDHDTRDHAGVISRGKVYIAYTHTAALRMCKKTPESAFCWFHQIADDYIVESVRIFNNMEIEDIIDILKETGAKRIFQRLGLKDLRLVYDKADQKPDI